MVPGCELSHEGAQDNRDGSGDYDESSDGLKIHIHKITAIYENAKRSEIRLPETQEQSTLVDRE